MKKTLFAGLIAVMLVAVLGTATVFAQGPVTDPATPAAGTGFFGRGPRVQENADPVGRMGDPDAEGMHFLEEYLVSYAADKLGLSAETIESRLDAGETLADIAQAQGVEDYTAFMQDALTYAREQATADGIVVPGWSNGRGGQESAPRYNEEDCETPGLYLNDGSQVGGRGGRWIH